MTRRKDEPHIEYRSFYSPIIDDYDFQQMPGDQFKVLFILKHSLGAAGIGFFKRLETAERAGVTPEELDVLIAKLSEPKGEAKLGWVVKDRNIVWIVNGLENEPTLTAENPKHVTYIRSLVAPLGEKAIVRRFRERYPKWFGEAECGPNPPPSIDRVSDTVSATVSDTLSDHKRQATSDGSLKPEDLKRSDVIQKFLDRFYDHPGPRREEVARQLLEALEPNGTRLKRGVRVSARNLAHLESCARAVMAKPPDTPNVAIVWTLMKLQDPELDANRETVTEAASTRTKQEIQHDERVTAKVEAACDRWAAENPKEFSEIDERIRREFPGDTGVMAVARRAAITTEISKRLPNKAA